MVFCPVSTEELALLASGGVLASVESFAVTPTFRRTFGLNVDDSEDAERTAALVAGLAGLQRAGQRLVVVAEVPVEDLRGEMGQVRVPALALSDASALFADDPENRRDVAVVRAALAGLSLEQAWDAPEHEALLERSDLLWHGPGEWASLIA